MDQFEEESKDQQQIEIPAEYSCSICLFLFYDPLKLPCNHSYCRACLAELMDTELLIKCPYCRGECQKKDIKFNNELDLLLKKNYPVEYNERQQFMKHLKESEGNVQKLKILYGNHFRQLPNGKPLRSNPQLVNDKEWTFYIKVEKDLVKNYFQKVEVLLDPSFGDVPITLRGEPLELKRTGFGEFRLEFKVWFQRWMKLPPIKLWHDLEFSPAGSHKIQVIKFSAKNNNSK